MALGRIDVAASGLLQVTTAQGARITFAADHLTRQLDRWWLVYDYGMRQGKAIQALDLSVTNSLPITWVEASVSPPMTAPRPNPSYSKHHV